MNDHLRTPILLALATLVTLFTVSCMTTPPVRGDVEALERQPAVSDVPDTGQEYIHAAERYSNPNSYRGGYQSPGNLYRGSGYGYGFGYGAY